MKGRKIGFIGLGEMGNPMSRNLLKAGFNVTVYDTIRARTIDVEKAGAKRARSCADMAANCDVIILMVADANDARKALFRRRGVWETAKPGTTVILMSTIDPYFCQEVAAKGKAKGIDVLDVPVSGAGLPVREGTLVFFAGGDKAVLDKCMPVLMAMGKKVFHMGGVGMGEVAKICKNYITFINSLVLSDCIKLASRAGLNLDQLHEVLMNSSARSGTLERFWSSLSRETAESSGKIMRTSHSKFMRKDLGLVMGLGQEHGIHVPIAAVSSQLDFIQYKPASE